MNDFVEVKFFENRANGQSKGFCVISLGSEQSMRICMDRLSKKELHGQNPVVTFPSKQALNQVFIVMHSDTYKKKKIKKQSYKLNRNEAVFRFIAYSLQYSL